MATTKIHLRDVEDDYNFIHVYWWNKDKSCSLFLPWSVHTMNSTCYEVHSRLKLTFLEISFHANWHTNSSHQGSTFSHQCVRKHIGYKNEKWKEKKNNNRGKKFLKKGSRKRKIYNTKIDIHGSNH